MVNVTLEIGQVKKWNKQPYVCVLLSLYVCVFYDDTKSNITIFISVTDQQKKS